MIRGEKRVLCSKMTYSNYTLASFLRLLFLPPIQGDAAYDATGVVGFAVCTLCRCLPFPELERGKPDIGTGAHDPENDDERMV